MQRNHFQCSYCLQHGIDNIHQLIKHCFCLLFHLQNNYSYVFTIKSKTWAIIHQLYTK